MTDQTHAMTVAEFEQLLQQPENADRLFELLDGELLEKMPTEEHGDIVLNFGLYLKLYLRENPIGRVTAEARHGLPDDPNTDLRPDVSLILDVSRPRVTKGIVPQMPDLAIEVKSPTDRLTTMRRKAAYYLEHGTRMVVLALPQKRLMEVYRPDADVEILTEADTLEGGDVLPGFAVAVADIFADD